MSTCQAEQLQPHIELTFLSAEMLLTVLALSATLPWAASASHLQCCRKARGGWGRGGMFTADCTETV